jgi:hypothetical protein
MDSMEFNTRAHGFHGIHGADVRSMVVISPEHLTRETTGAMAYRAGWARVSSDRSRMTAGVRFFGSHRLAHAGANEGALFVVAEPEIFSGIGDR